MKNYELIALNNKAYKCRRIQIEGYDSCLIASTILLKKIINSEDNYYSKETQYIDEQIFFYIPPTYYRHSDKKLASLIQKSF